MSDFLTRIAQERDERVRDLHLDLPIPTWDGDLVVRFEVMPRKDLEAFANRKRTPQADLDFLIQAATALYIRDESEQAEGTRHETRKDYVRLEDERGFPILFDERLALKFGKEELTTARDVVLYLFGDNTIATSAMSVKVINWMQNTDVRVADALVGES